MAAEEQHQRRPPAGPHSLGQAKQTGSMTASSLTRPRSATCGGAAVKEAAGQSARETVWRYLFTHPVEQVGQPVPRDPRTPTDPQALEKKPAKAKK
jgi:hypothetical protein